MKKTSGGRRRFEIIACVTMLACLGELSRVSAQASTGTARPNGPQFDVASIKVNKSGNVGTRFGFNANSFTAENIPMTVLFRLAYGVEEDQIIGLPSWTQSQRYDITAKMDGSTVINLSKLPLEQREQMLRPILADRFQLKVHADEKIARTLVLAIAKGGPTFHTAKPDSAYTDQSHIHTLRILGPGYFVAQGVPMELMTRMLSDQLGRAVVDETGLQGQFDFTLKWLPDQPSQPGTQPFEADDLDMTERDESLSGAITDQLGLQLEMRKQATNVIVVDHIEELTPN